MKKSAMPERMTAMETTSRRRGQLGGDDEKRHRPGVCDGSPEIAIGCHWTHLMRMPPKLQQAAVRISSPKARPRLTSSGSVRIPGMEFPSHGFPEKSSGGLTNRNKNVY
jgi:hypothetical protein